ncbi:hypothetical protein V1264_008748 [Littorina saxatilis]|uniref:Uncharacterized protein n=1 Tax=Littorina saxatilis TaxID=31220 RepID=A0AAN9ATP6_9CAEN
MGVQLDFSSAHDPHSSDCARFTQQVRALQQELTQARSRVQVLEREVKRKDDQIKQNDSANQLQEEKARHQNTAKQLKDCKKTCSALEKSCKERRHITRTQPNS